MNRRAIIIIASCCIVVGAVTLFMLRRTDDEPRLLPATPPKAFAGASSVVIPLGISVAEAANFPKGVALTITSAAVTDPLGFALGENVAIDVVETDEGTYGISVTPQRMASFKPGKYHVAADIDTGTGIRRIEQDFLWGVLAINPNKSMYRPGETAKLALAVLDERGNMVCNAKVALQVQSSKFKVQNLSTEDGTIRVNEECRQKKVTQRPDYEAEYTVADPGIYQMTLTATTKNGSYIIEDWFEVTHPRPSGDPSQEGTPFFDIERITATRIYPVHEYEVKIKVTPEEDFRGVVREQVPESFKISSQLPQNEKTALAGDFPPDSDGVQRAGLGNDISVTNRKNLSSVSVDNSSNEPVEGFAPSEHGLPSPAPHSVTGPDPLYHNFIEWTVDWRAGETYELSYTYKAPEVSPQFYLLGPLEVRGNWGDKGNKGGELMFREARQWQIAVDAIAFDATSNSGSQTNATVFSWSHTVTGSNAILIVGVAMGDTTDADRTVNSVTYNSVSMTNIREDDNDVNDISSSLWYLVNPSTGSAYTIEVTLNGTNTRALGGAMSFTGVDQSSPIDAHTGQSVTDNATLSTNIVTVADNAMVVDVMDKNVGGAPTVGASQTERWNVNLVLANYSGGSHEGPQTPAGSVTMSWSTGDSGSDWVHSVASLKPFTNSTPSISSITDTPDPTNPKRSVTFSVDWSDADSGEMVKVKICKTDALSARNCTGGFWASSTAFTASDPESLVYDIVGGDAGQTRSYSAFVCDDGASCSASTSGTFAVNAVSNVPDVLIRDATWRGGSVR